jgi:hypothetical protein
MSWDLVLGFFPEEVQALILDTTISDLMINGTLIARIPSYEPSDIVLFVPV